MSPRPSCTVTASASEPRIPSSRRCADVRRYTSWALASASPARPTSSRANTSSSSPYVRPERPTAMPSAPSGPPLGASGSAIVERRPDASMCRRSSSSWIIASRSSPVSSATRPPSPSQHARRRRRGRAREPRGAMIHASISARSGRGRASRAAASSRRGRSRRPRPRRRPPGRAARASRRSASSMSAAPSVMPRRVGEQLELAALASRHVPRARTAASRWRAANTASAAPAATVTSGTAVFSPNDPCQTGLISERKKASAPTSADVARAGSERHREHRQQVPGAAEGGSRRWRCRPLPGRPRRRARRRARGRCAAPRPQSMRTR